MELNQYETPASYQSFQNLIKKAKPTPAPSTQLLDDFPPLPNLSNHFLDSIPTLSDLGFSQDDHTTFFKGGEREGLKKMHHYM